MKLEGLLLNYTYNKIQGDLEKNIKGIANDSRKIQEGYVFVAIKGYEQDGHLYIGQAIQNGATAVILEETDNYHKIIEDSVTVIQVKNGREALALMSTRFYNHPSSQFKLVGITGTNGKTSTVFLINNVLEYYKRKTGLIGTIVNKIGNKSFTSERTTPESVELQRLFKEMSDENVNDVVMEVSSHALSLHRVDYSKFDVGVFTNLTLDHLDYHKTMENYKKAKAKLFTMCTNGVINIDDEAGSYMMEEGTCSKYLTYSTKKREADLYAKNIVSQLAGVEYELIYNEKSYFVTLQTPGLFSVYNSLAAIGVLLLLNISVEQIIEALKTKSQIKGRFQALNSPKGYTAIVDYAHTPDGLLNVLSSAKKITSGRIITVFGCGGDRDRTKRPAMGKIAGELSDLCIITSDNPRTEIPKDIIDEIETGMKETTCEYIKIVDRREGIIKGLEQAKQGDLVVVAGKGHENYQIIGKEKQHFDDTEVILDYYKGVKNDQ